MIFLTISYHLFLTYRGRLNYIKFLINMSVKIIVKENFDHSLKKKKLVLTAVLSISNI